MKITVLPDDLHSRAIYLERQELPDFCMGDFSIVGFVVDRYRQALMLLQSAGYRVDEQEIGSEIFISSPSALPEIQAMLQEGSVRCDFADIADTLYQA